MNWAAGSATREVLAALLSASRRRSPTAAGPAEAGLAARRAVVFADVAEARRWRCASRPPGSWPLLRPCAARRPRRASSPFRIPAPSLLVYLGADEEVVAKGFLEMPTAANPVVARCGPGHNIRRPRITAARTGEFEKKRSTSEARQCKRARGTRILPIFAAGVIVFVGAAAARLMLHRPQWSATGVAVGGVESHVNLVQTRARPGGDGSAAASGRPRRRLSRRVGPDVGAGDG